MLGDRSPYLAEAVEEGPNLDGVAVVAEGEAVAALAEVAAAVQSWMAWLAPRRAAACDSSWRRDSRRRPPLLRSDLLVAETHYHARHHPPCSQLKLCCLHTRESLSLQPHLPAPSTGKPPQRSHHPPIDSAGCASTTGRHRPAGASSATLPTSCSSAQWHQPQAWHRLQDA
jgi:hypothetical protein